MSEKDFFFNGLFDISGLMEIEIVMCTMLWNLTPYYFRSFLVLTKMT